MNRIHEPSASRQQIRRLKTALVALFAFTLIALPMRQGRAGPSDGSKAADRPVAAPDFSRIEDPFDIISSIQVADGKVVARSTARLPVSDFSAASFKRSAQAATTLQPSAKIHPALQRRLAAGEQGAERVIISFQDDIKIPRFPKLLDDERRDSPTNRAVVARSEQLAAQVEAQRAPVYAQLAQELAAHKARVLETFWLIKAALVELPLAEVPAVAARADVLAIEPEVGDEPPPTVAAGRGRIASDQYFNLGQTFGFIGLLDTGVRVTHTLFVNPDHIAFEMDCNNGGPNCSDTGQPGFNPDDDCWNHGTSTAGIITGNGNLGDTYRGVTATTLDTLKVYPNGCGFLNQTAVLRAFQRVLTISDGVVVAEMQGFGSDTSAISLAADSAFDGGAAVIAANGNFGPSASTVNTPANAHKVIGVGVFDVNSLQHFTYQSRGPAPDGRIKPDIIAPNNTVTASSASSTALQTFGGTSGATPYAAGAAMLLRNWLRGSNLNIDPGHVYAQLILSGQQPYPFDNVSGAGRLRLPDLRGQIWWGKTTVSQGQTVNIPLFVNANARNIFDGALWWPETPAQAHNDLNLFLVDPFGNELAASTDINSVFERARVSGMGLASGTWQLRIRGNSVPAGPQTVYWAALTSRNAWLGP